MGVTLFSDTDIFQEGMIEWQMIGGGAREAAKNINRKRREASTSTNRSGLRIMPRSPLEPSESRSRQGTRDSVRLDKGNW